MSIAWHYKGALVTALVATIAVACGVQDASDEAAEVSSAVVVPAAAPAARVRETPTLAWVIEEVDAGVGPDLTLTSDGVVYVAYIREGENGSVRSAARNGAGWDITTVTEGGIFGTLSMAIGPDDAAHISYYGGAAPRRRGRFRRNRGDVTYAVLRNGEWSVGPPLNQEGGGWDSKIVVDADGTPHLSAISPYSGENGIAYNVRNRSGEWVLEEIASGFQSWDDAASLAIDPLGNPHISYLDREFGTLALASRNEAGWNVDIVDDDSESGMFSSLVIDETGRFHISYLQMTGTSAGTVKYATIGQDDSAWEIRKVGALQRLSYVWPGPRRFTSMVVDREGNPWIAYSDEEVLNLAVWDGSSWQTQTVVDAGERRLGQVVSLKLDASDHPHLAYFEVIDKSPLTGVVKYAKGAPE
jgi:hypothetical protein